MPFLSNAFHPQVFLTMAPTPPSTTVGVAGSVSGQTLAQLRQRVLNRLGDLQQVIWTAQEVDEHLEGAYLQMATTHHLFWDITYLEDIPYGFSITQPWEARFLTGSGTFLFGVANYTYADEFEAGTHLADSPIDPRTQIGPGNYTSPFELYEGALSRSGASTAIPATAQLPETLAALDRATWDKRGLDAMEARTLSRVDSRYEITAGEVYGYIWQKDGVRTLRKVRVPAAIADLVDAVGDFGLLRKPTDLSGDVITGSWGIMRRCPGQFPMGTESFGAPRRVFLEGHNFRVEHWRQGRAMEISQDVCELPDRYAFYLCDSAMAKCLSRRGPGQDLVLAAHFEERWQRNLARLARRLDLFDAEHIAVMGGDDMSLTTRPPRPKLPWPYGTVVR
jgi:hypothetical protein